MPDFRALARDFDYDLWANRKWLECLLGKGLPEPDTGIFRHMLAAQQIWLSRMQGTSPTEMPAVEPTANELDRLHDAWIDTLSNLEADREVVYSRTTGELFTVWLSDVAHHVTNHGTYHRGELRGLCRARGDEDFPESDFAGFMRMKPTL